MTHASRLSMPGRAGPCRERDPWRKDRSLWPRLGWCDLDPNDWGHAVLLLLFCFVAFAPRADSADDPEILIERIRSKMTANLSQLPNYTCHEIIDRLHRRGTAWGNRDRLELEVAFVGNRELFSRPGDARFEEALDKIVPTGTIGNGAFGSHADSIFTEGVASFTYVGFCKKEGHKAIRFNFRVPQEKSHFFVKHNSVGGIVGYQGSFWVDSETLDLVRLDLKVDHIAPNIGISSIEEAIHYKVVRLKNSEFLLPRTSELSVADIMGNYSVNLITLQECREFTGESVVKYGPPTESAPQNDR